MPNIHPQTNTIMQNKDIITEKIVSSPQTLTDSEIAFIVADAELRELYEAAVSMSEAVCDVPEFDTDMSLAQLHGMMLHPKSRGFLHWLFAASARRAAVIIAICLSLTVFAIVAVNHMNNESEDKSPNTSSVFAQSNSDGAPNEQPLLTEKLQFDDAPLSVIIHDICEKYGCNAKYSEGVDLDSRYHLTIPAGASLQDAVSRLNAFDEIKVSVKDHTLIVEHCTSI